MEIKYARRMYTGGMSIIREMYKLLTDPEIISFAGGEPAPDLFPLDGFRKASDDAFEEYGRNMLSYDVTEGFGPLREYIATTRMKNVNVEAKLENIVITNGSQQGIDFTARVFLDEGDVVICEGPTYLAALNTFNAYGPKIVQVKMDEDGMNMEELEQALKANPNTKFIYTIPDFQNPTGITMSVEKRKKIVELSIEYGVVVVEDNPYIDLRYVGDRLPAIKSFDKVGNVIYMGSFSKICAPGVRIGWVCAEPAVLQGYVKTKQASDLQPSTVTQRQLYKYIETNNVDSHINSMLPFYGSRGRTMLAAIEREFPKNISYTKSEGGFFTWVTLPEHIDAMDVFKKGVEAKVAFVPGGAFFNEKGHDNHMRISFSKVTEDQIEEGVKRLGAILKEML